MTQDIKTTSVKRIRFGSEKAPSSVDSLGPLITGSMVTASFKMSEDKKFAVWLLLITIDCGECRICVFGPVAGRSTDEFVIIGIEPACEKNCCDGRDPGSTCDNGTSNHLKYVVEIYLHPIAIPDLFHNSRHTSLPNL